MREKDVEIIIQRSERKVPQGQAAYHLGQRHRQFIALAFKSSYQTVWDDPCADLAVLLRNPMARSSGGTSRLKRECIRPKTPTNLEEAREVVCQICRTLSTSSRDTTPASAYASHLVDKLDCGRALCDTIFRERKRKLVAGQNALRAQLRAVKLLYANL